jgi:hypothetical protein
MQLSARFPQKQVFQQKFGVFPLFFCTVQSIGVKYFYEYFNRIGVRVFLFLENIVLTKFGRCYKVGTMAGPSERRRFPNNRNFCCGGRGTR